jgi:dihydrofolate reductase
VTLPKIIVIAALSADGFISRGRGLPWQLPADQAFFRQVLAAHDWVLVGAETFAEMQGCFAARQRVLVLGRRGLPAWAGPQQQRVTSMGQALDEVRAGAGSQLLCIGGAQTYAAALPLAVELRLTRVELRLGQGLAFPALDEGWRLHSSRAHLADAQHAHAMKFEHWIRET